MDGYVGVNYFYNQLTHHVIVQWSGQVIDRKLQNITESFLNSVFKEVSDDRQTDIQDVPVTVTSLPSPAKVPPQAPLLPAPSPAKELLDDAEPIVAEVYSLQDRHNTFTADVFVHSVEEAVSDGEASADKSNQECMDSPPQQTHAMVRPFSPKSVPRKDISLKRVNARERRLLRRSTGTRGHNPRLPEKTLLPYECPECHISFKLFIALLKHVNTVHKEKGTNKIRRASELVRHSKEVPSSSNKIMREASHKKRPTNTTGSNRISRMNNWGKWQRQCRKSKNRKVHDSSDTTETSTLVSGQVKHNDSDEVLKTPDGLPVYEVTPVSEEIVPLDMDPSSSDQPVFPCMMVVQDEMPPDQLDKSKLEETEWHPPAKQSSKKSIPSTIPIPPAIRGPGELCPVCHNIYTSKSSLKVHMRLHTGEKPYVCRVCSEGFRQLQTLQTHVMKCHYTDSSDSWAEYKLHHSTRPIFT
ncbi:zinc finger protein 567-like [Watersipora subatra]|uniref:zinc finger protein 567-like n=1 Tax=Watersipora subatra TaxID=2589382 RepID=UPI00355BB629